MDTIKAHYKADYTGRCREKKASIVISICNYDTILVTLPSRLVKDQFAKAVDSIENTDLSFREIEAEVMKHMPSNFLSWLHKNDCSILHILKDMVKEYDVFVAQSNS